MGKTVIPFRMGDVVMIEGREHIIHKCNFDGRYQNFTYSTNRGAWWDHEECSLAREADKESLKQLFKSLEDEEASYYEE